MPGGTEIFCPLPGVFNPERCGLRARRATPPFNESSVARPSLPTWAERVRTFATCKAPFTDLWPGHLQVRDFHAVGRSPQPRPVTTSHDQSRCLDLCGDYEVSGMPVIKRWFDRRKRDPEGKRSSLLDDIVDQAWSPFGLRSSWTCGKCSLSCETSSRSNANCLTRS
jgi:hypothetical protein